MVGTYRDVEASAGQPLAGTLGALAREPVVERIALGGLGRADVARLIGHTIGATPAQPLVEAVHDRCGGNPFFITELLRLLQSERRLAAPDATAAARREVPVGVRDVLRRRLARLPAQSGTLLMVAAVAGRGFDLDLVEAVTGLDDEAALDAAEAAVLAGLVLEDDRAAGRYRFAHALVRETIYEDISRARRARLHARVVDALMAVRGAEPEPAAEMASELGSAWELGAELMTLGSERNDPALLSAGHWQVGTVALYRGDLQEAQHHLEHALATSQDIAPGAPGDAPVELTLLCQAYLGVARAYQGHVDAGLRLTGQAVGSARRLGDPLSLVNVLFFDAWAATVAEGSPGPWTLPQSRRHSLASTGSGNGGRSGSFSRDGRRPAAATRAAASSGSGPHWPRWTRREPQRSARSCSGCWPRSSCWPAILPRPATRCAWPPRRRTGWASTYMTRSCAPCKPGSGKPISRGASTRWPNRGSRGCGRRAKPAPSHRRPSSPTSPTPATWSTPRPPKAPTWRSRSSTTPTAATTRRA